MDKKLNDEQELEYLEEKIKHAESQNLPIEKYILREIEILENTIIRFVEEMESQGRLHDGKVAEIEIRQYMVLKRLAKKIKYPTDKYDELIKSVKIRMFGEENYQNFFGEK